MPNPLIKWAKRNTHSDPPPSLEGYKGGRDLSFQHSHPVRKEEYTSVVVLRQSDKKKMFLWSRLTLHHCTARNCM